MRLAAQNIGNLLFEAFKLLLKVDEVWRLQLLHSLISNAMADLRYTSLKPAESPCQNEVQIMVNVKSLDNVSRREVPDPSSSW